MSKKYTVATLGAILWAFSCAYGDATMSGAASRAWVTNYVGNIASELERKIVTTTSGGKTVYSVPVEGGGVVSNVVEEATVGGLVIGEASALAVRGGITNGMLFAWNDISAYVNGDKAIEATRTNLTYSVYRSAYLDSQTWLVDAQTNRFCRLFSSLIQPSVAKRLIGGAR